MNSLAKPITTRFVLQFTLPGIIMMIFNSIYVIVDGMFVSNAVGTAALSAVNIVYPYQALSFAIAIMLGIGGSAVVGRQQGEGDMSLARESFSFITLVSFLVGILLTIGGVFFADPLVRFLGANDAIYDYCIDYTVTLSCFIPLSMLQVHFQYFFASAGKPSLGLVSTVAGGAANIVLDYLFIVVFDWGIAGAAAATGIGFFIPAVIGLVYFSVMRKDTLYFVFPKYRGKTLLDTCTNGLSEMVINLSGAITTVFFNVIMMRLIGENGVAAICIIFYAQFLFGSVFFGFVSGGSPLVSFNYGAKDRDKLQKLFRIDVLFILISSVLLFLTVLLIGDPVVAAFSERGTPVFEIGSRGMRLYAANFLFMGVNVFASGFFTALSNGRISALLSFLRTFVFAIGTMLTMPLALGVDGVFLSIPAAELLSVIVSVYFILLERDRYGYWPEHWKNRKK